jgi:SAM-dependent methyltransferase
MDGSEKSQSPRKARVLLLGSGSRKVPQTYLFKDPHELVTLDIEPEGDPDIVWDLEELPYSFAASNSFDAIIAEEVLEHTGQQGDYKFFFAQFGEFWRILRHGGKICITSPKWSREWAWGDPGHKRVFTVGTFAFLCDDEYKRQLGPGGTAMTDYRKFLGPQKWRAEAAYYGEANIFITLVADKQVLPVEPPKTE